MYLSLDDAIYVYARACRAWYGRKAASNALRAAAECRQRQDFEGERVWKVLVKQGEKVDVGDVLFILEVMKTEVPHTASEGGTVKSVNIYEGQEGVDAGTLAVVIG